MRMTSLLDCHFCAISEYDRDADAVRTLAEYDHVGQRLPDASPYRLRDFPLTRRVLEEQVTAVVNVDDPHGDPAEVAELRREGDRSLLMVPLVVQGAAWACSRSSTSGARASTRGRSSAWRGPSPGRRPSPSRTPNSSPSGGAATRTSPASARRWPASPHTSPNSAEGSRRSDALGTVARAVCEALGAISCVASMDGESAGAFGAGQVVAPGARRRAGRQRQPRRRTRPLRAHGPHAGRHPAPLAGRGSGRAARLRRRDHRRRRASLSATPYPHRSPASRKSSTTPRRRSSQKPPRRARSRGPLIAPICSSFSDDQQLMNFAAAVAPKLRTS